jgi:hypothetical protein
MPKPQNSGKLLGPHFLKVWVQPPIERQVQIWKRVRILLGATLPFSLLMLWAFDPVRAQTTGSKAPPPAAKQPFNPAAKPWQPDEFQRAMVLGTTMPNEVPLPGVSLESNPVPETLPPLPETVPPIFRKPLPIISPAKEPSKKPQ